MSRKLIRENVLKRVVAGAGQEFWVLDISQDVRVRNAHPEFISHGNCNFFVVGALSDHCVNLGIVEGAKATSEGAR